jgi:hypothetical protein
VLAGVVKHVKSSAPPCELFTIQLAVVREGPYAGSVAVYANRQRVATLRSDMTSEWAPVVAQLTESGTPATCRAVLAGVENDRETIGIWALLPSRASAWSGGPFLPPLTGRRLEVRPETATALDETIKSRAKRFTERRIGVVDLATRSVYMDHAPIGSLTADAHASLALVAGASAAGHPTTCQVRLVREPGQPLRVVADLP